MGPGRKTSVPNAENGPPVRKSAGGWGEKLPCQMPKTGLRYGSRDGAGEKNFRAKCRKWASGTEVAMKACLGRRDTPTISTNWNACGILDLWSWTHTASGKKASYGYVYSDVAIVLF